MIVPITSEIDFTCLDLNFSKEKLNDRRRKWNTGNYSTR